MSQDDRSRLRHGIRGNLNAIKLGLSALELGLSRDETVEFLEYLDQAAEKLAEQMGEFDALPEPVEPPAAEPVPRATAWADVEPAPITGAAVVPSAS